MRGDIFQLALDYTLYFSLPLMLPLFQLDPYCPLCLSFSLIVPYVSACPSRCEACSHNATTDTMECDTCFRRHVMEDVPNDVCMGK